MPNQHHTHARPQHHKPADTPRDLRATLEQALNAAITNPPKPPLGLTELDAEQLEHRLRTTYESIAATTLLLGQPALGAETIRRIRAYADEILAEAAAGR